MNTLFSVVMAIQVCMALIIIGLVLLQHGKGADMGAAFGSGASGSLFGATGSSSFLSKATGIAATLFFLATLALAYLGNRHTAPTTGVMDNVTMPPTTQIAPTTPPAVVVQPVKAEPTPASKANAQNHADQIPK